MASEIKRESREPSPVEIAGYAAIALLVLLIVIQLTVGFYQVRPGEAAALQTFGAARFEPVTQEGLHWHWPWPIGAKTTIQVRKSRTAEVGFQTLPDGYIDETTQENWQRDYNAATMITGDLNILEIQLVAQYFISDLNAYLFEADDPGVTFEHPDGNRTRIHRSHPQDRPDGQSIKDALEIAVRRSIGHRNIDQALVSEREAIEQETKENAQDILNSYQTGITITSVQLQEIKPPDEVQAAFDDVLQAREEKDTRINEALTFQSKTLPEARGQAERILKEAEAYRSQRINAAEGEAGRFESILNEYQASPEIIAKRMYLETMDSVLPRVNQIIVAGPELRSLIINTEGGRTRIIPAEIHQESTP